MTLFYDARLIALEAFDTHGVLHVVPGGDSSRVAFCTCLHCCLGRSPTLSEYLLDVVRCERLLCVFREMGLLYGGIGMIMIMDLECTVTAPNYTDKFTPIENRTRNSRLDSCTNQGPR